MPGPASIEEKGPGAHIQSGISRRSRTRGGVTLNRLLDIYCKLLDAVTAALLFVMVVLVFGNVVLRYGFNSGWSISEELSRWAFIWVVFLGSIAAMHHRGHLGSDMLISRLPRLGQKVCYLSLIHI